MKSHTDYVRQECVADIRRQIAAYKRFQTLTEQWLDVSIDASKAKIVPRRWDQSQREVGSLELLETG